MSKKNFITLILGTIGGIMFALGMCMCLLPEWNTFNQGIAVGAVGAAVLLAMPAVRRKMAGKAVISFSKKAVGTVLLGITGALTFGAGMCMVMVWSLLVWGIIVGIAGIILLLCLIPAVKGLK